MDMWDPSVASVREHVPEAEGKIVFDRFHVAKHLGDAVDQVRRKEHKTLKAAGDDCFAGTRYDWLRNPAKMEPEDRKEFAELRNSEWKTARAWALKETAMALYDYIYETAGEETFPLVARVGSTEPAETDDRGCPDMLKRRFENIITYLRRRITNASSESINARSMFKWVKYTARGFRNRQNFIHAIFFHCGGLDLSPEATK